MLLAFTFYVGAFIRQASGCFNQSPLVSSAILLEFDY